jgi:hypothetical protein
MPNKDPLGCRRRERSAPSPAYRRVWPVTGSRMRGRDDEHLVGIEHARRRQLAVEDELRRRR